MLAVLEFGDAVLPGRATVPFVVTDVMEGGSLKSMLASGHRLTPSQALVVGLDAARGLDHAHRRGLVHRHVDTSCVLFDGDGHARLGDFGLARAVGEVYEDRAVGPYASPEQAEGQRVGGRSDVYSLALVMVEAVTGEVPSPTGDLELDQDFGALRSVLERAGRREPEERPDAEELEIALMAAAEDLPRPEPLPLVGTGLLAGAGPVVTSRADQVEVPGPLEVPLGTSGVDEAAAGPVTSGAVTSGAVADGASVDAGNRTGPALVAVVGLLVVLAGVAVWWFALRTPTHAVPNVVGQQVSTAANAARASKWRLDKSTLVRQDGTRPGEVVAQSPKAGTQLAEGKTLRLTVSLGTSLVAFPTDLAGQSQDLVTSTLRDAGFKVGRTTTTNDENVAKGDVVAVRPTSAPDAKGQVPRGTVVDLVVSDGPAPRTVPPGLLGRPVPEVEAALKGVQLSAAPTLDYNPGVAPGSVISVDPPSGIEVPRGTAVQVVVSRGPAPVAIPNVAGKSVAEATSTLRAAGFGVSSVRGDPTLNVDGLRVSPRSFLQVNLEVNRLVAEDVDALLAELQPIRLLDLYGGIGNLSARAHRRAHAAAGSCLRTEVAQPVAVRGSAQLH